MLCRPKTESVEITAICVPCRRGSFLLLGHTLRQIGPQPSRPFEVLLLTPLLPTLRSYLSVPDLSY